MTEWIATPYCAKRRSQSSAVRPVYLRWSWFSSADGATPGCWSEATPTPRTPSVLPIFFWSASRDDARPACVCLTAAALLLHAGVSPVHLCPLCLRRAPRVGPAQVVMGVGRSTQNFVTRGRAVTRQPRFAPERSRAARPCSAVTRWLSDRVPRRNGCVAGDASMATRTAQSPGQCGSRFIPSPHPGRRRLEPTPQASRCGALVLPPCLRSEPL